MNTIIFRQDSKDTKNGPVLLQELVRGKLRQGWAWHDSFDLNNGREAFIDAVRKKTYSNNESGSRKEAERIFAKLEGMLAIKSGDLIIVPHQPELGKAMAMVATTVTGLRPYQFIGPINGDFRHCINIDPRSIKYFSRRLAHNLPKVDRALWGKGGYAAPVNFVKDPVVREALIHFLQMDAKAKSLTDDKALEEPDFTSWSEGKRRDFYGTRIERNPQLRQAAVKIHGLNCQVCGFNFEKVYGKHGVGYIHVHHLKPLSESMGPRDVVPQDDLAVLCVNCHAMVHRQRKHTLSLPELKALIKTQ